MRLMLEEVSHGRGVIREEEERLDEALVTKRMPQAGGRTHRLQPGIDDMIISK